MKNTLKGMVFESVQKPLLGLITSGSGTIVAFESSLIFVQYTAGLLAVFVAIGTLRLTYMRIKKLKQELRDGTIDKDTK